MASTILSDNGVSSGSAGIKTTADSTGALALQTTTAGGAATTAMTIDTSQNVGIGTSSPAQKLHIQQTSAAASLTQLVLQNADNTAGTGSAIGFANHTSSGLLTGKLESAIDGANAYSLRFYTYQSGLNERMRIDASGNLLVGTTSQIGAEQVGISFADASKNGLGIQVQASASGAGFVAFRNSSGTLIGSITRVTTTNAVVYNTTSDQRLKSNIADADTVLDKLMTVKVRQFDWTEGNLHQDYGFIAQELEPTLSGLVTKGKTNEDMWQVDYSRLTPHLVKAIQEQQALITALIARITALEAK